MTTNTADIPAREMCGFTRAPWRARVLGLVLGAALLAPAWWTASAALGAAGAPAAAPQTLFDRDAPLALDLYADLKALCRDPQRKGCADLSATLVYREDDGAEKSVGVSLRSRGRFRTTSGGCEQPALFVFFTGDTAGTLFADEKMLPLTTHCRKGAQYEQYVIKEYLAYRIYNTLTDKSLRARLARVTYHDRSGSAEPIVRYAFFTEHFDSLARREDAVVFKPERFDLLEADANEIATLDLFEYMIGNTDWSTVFGHNVVLIRDAAGRPTAVPYDFDFSGLVDADYATVAPQLPIRDVKQRVFRGLCRPDTDWERVFAGFAERREAIYRLLDGQPMDGAARAQARRYVDGFFAVLDSPARRDREIVAACRAPG